MHTAIVIFTLPQRSAILTVPVDLDLDLIVSLLWFYYNLLNLQPNNQTERNSCVFALTRGVSIVWLRAMVAWPGRSHGSGRLARVANEMCRCVGRQQDGFSRHYYFQ